MKVKKTLSNWLTTRYKLIIRNEESLEEKKQIPYTYSIVIFIATLFSGLVFTLGFFISQKFFSESTLTTDNGAEFVRSVKTLNQKIDSISSQVQGREFFIKNFRNVVGGKVKYFNNEDSAKSKIPVIRKVSDSINPDYIDPNDKLLREEFEGGSGNPLMGGQGIKSLKSLYLFAPLKGVISKKYNPRQQNYGVDIVSTHGSTVSSIADGTIIMTSWTSDKGYVVAIQHQSNLISVYTHCATLFQNKRVGSFLKAGEAVALLGKNSKNKPYLHFELWYKGTPVNPEAFVSF
ncbi:murein hydrolase activator EnvC [uncultured Microscilla sp.]|uniref:murein hydrolase activator EnvC family protein n=1 Tax=uncultured Microscilla sp. TaxID=432653 RepID=UPI0026249CD1|nr:M23 family metallopeptidase [uncultured Microscilla sp.]